MTDKHKHEIDEVTGVHTTGHEWDGIKELNKPLPRWWVWVFYASIIWSIGYWIAYPAWPTLTSYTHGMLDYSQRKQVMDEVAAGKAAQAKFVTAIASETVDQIQKNPELREFAIAGGRAAFGDNCAGCHGRGAQGGPGYPNLNDDDWLWGGTLDQIEHTLQVGVRSTDPETRQNQMPRFGLDQMLEPAQISDVADYVLSLSGTTGDQAAIERGKQIFAEQCVACHGENAKGNMELGSPNLTDGIWLYGKSKADVVATITNGRGGVMPTWGGRLDPATIKMLAVYVHSLGGGQ